MKLNRNALHYYAETAVARSNPNQHLLIRDDYPEVIQAETSAADDVPYSIPHNARDSVSKHFRFEKG